MKQLGENTGGIKSSVRVLGSGCKHYRNSEARKITGGETLFRVPACNLRAHARELCAVSS